MVCDIVVSSYLRFASVTKFYTRYVLSYSFVPSGNNSAVFTFIVCD